MKEKPVAIATLLALSGACALMYQVAWFRELRLVFGGATVASAAVLAVFMGGLGIGGALLGPGADRSPNPLRRYSLLEIGIAVAAAFSPLLLMAVRALYIALGGPMALAPWAATFARGGLAALVLLPPTILMGGTLPAAIRAALSAEDERRNSAAILYGVNTLGAVVGAVLANFILLEYLGTRATIWQAACLNAFVALVAYLLSMEKKVSPEAPPRPRIDATPEPLPQPGAIQKGFLYITAFIVGCAFFLMEIVWYRMLTPLLGGTTYTFGLILALALVGIGAGGAVYAAGRQFRIPTLATLSVTLTLEAALLALPFALGDAVAVAAEALRALGALGFAGQLLGWTLVAGFVVLPPAFLAGYQFPLLIGLLGHGRENVGRQTGIAYAWNTTGSIAGALAGGFGMLPALGALGAWKLVIGALAGYGVLVLLAAERRERAPLRLSLSATAAIAAVCVALFATGPTAIWRHGGIGAGRAAFALDSRDEYIRTANAERRALVWEADGRESAVAITNASGLAFVVNGKNDGNAIFDASTQIMLGVLPAYFHGNPESAFVIGMGTGSTAGWLGLVPSIDRVDVAELEPVTLEMAKRCALVNGDALNNPKLNVVAGDGRELLLTAPDSYDIIVSEPSNPYRAGVSTLYTREFYQSVAQRLNEDGVFAQWIQGYEVDGETIQIVYATLRQVFPYVETWQTNAVDLMLVCSKTPRAYDGPALRARMNELPYRHAFLDAWSAVDLEGIFSRYVANDEFPGSFVPGGTPINTDDRTIIEYRFARTVGHEHRNSANALTDVSTLAQTRQPARFTGELDWNEVEEQRLHVLFLSDTRHENLDALPDGFRQRAQAFTFYLQGEFRAALTAWGQQDRVPAYPVEAAMIGDALAESGHEHALQFAESVGRFDPLAADAIRARYLTRTNNLPEAVPLVVDVYERMGENPWALPFIMDHALRLAQDLTKNDVTYAPTLLEAVDEPFALHLFEAFRQELALDLASRIDVEVAYPFIEAYEPYPHWTEEFLRYRALAYRRLNHPLTEQAEADYAYFNGGNAYRVATP